MSSIFFLNTYTLLEKVPQNSIFSSQIMDFRVTLEDRNFSEIQTFSPVQSFYMLN